MKSYKMIERYQNAILAKTSNRGSIELNSIKYDKREKESFDHALTDLRLSGLVVYTQLNPTIRLKRIA